MLFRRIWTHSRTYKRRKNVVADALSCLDLTQKQHDMIMDTKNPHKSYVNQTGIDEVLEDVFPMPPKEIKKHQRKDKKLLKSVQENSCYQLKKVEGHNLVHYKDKIYVRDSLKNRVMEWYHTYLVHPGSTRMISTIQTLMHWHGIRKDVEHYVQTCDICQRCKKQQKSMVIFHPK